MRPIALILSLLSQLCTFLAGVCLLHALPWVVAPNVDFMISVAEWMLCKDYTVVVACVVLGVSVWASGGWDSYPWLDP
jgi:hypothetical protein